MKKLNWSDQLLFLDKNKAFHRRDLRYMRRKLLAAIDWVHTICDLLKHP